MPTTQPAAKTLRGKLNLVPNSGRVVLVNEKGQRVLDTLIKPQYQDLALKGGMRQDLHRISKAKAETIDTVRERVLDLIKGKKVVGYHLPQKLADFGILNKVASASTKKTPEKPTAHGIAKKLDSDSDSPLRMPNPITKEETQQAIDTISA